MIAARGPRGEGARRTGPARRRAQPCATAAGSSSPRAGCCRRRSPTKSSSTIARASRKRRAATRLPRRPARANWPSGVPRGLSSPSKSDEHDRAPQRARLDRARELHGHRRAGGAVVGAHEAGQVLRVVVGAQHHEARGRGPARARSRCAARRARPGSGRPAAAAAAARPAAGRAASPPAAGPARPACGGAAGRRAESKRSAGAASPRAEPLEPSSPKGSVPAASSATRTPPISSAGPRPRSSRFMRQLWRAARRPVGSRAWISRPTGIG